MCHPHPAQLAPSFHWGTASFLPLTWTGCPIFSFATPMPKCPHYEDLEFVAAFFLQGGGGRRRTMPPRFSFLGDRLGKQEVLGKKLGCKAGLESSGQALLLYNVSEINSAKSAALSIQHTVCLHGQKALHSLSWEPSGASHPGLLTVISQAPFFSTPFTNTNRQHLCNKHWVRLPDKHGVHMNHSKPPFHGKFTKFGCRTSPRPPNAYVQNVPPYSERWYMGGPVPISC